MAKQGTLAQHLSKVTNPQNWKKEFKNQVLELLGGIAELYMIDKALETIIGNGKKLNDFQDPQIRERMKTIIAGGLTPNKQGQNTGKRPIAPIIWELFNIQLYPHKGSSPLNQNTEDLIEYLKIHGIENITIRKEESKWFSSYSRFYWIVSSLVKFLKIIDKVPSKDPIRTLVDEVCGVNHYTKAKLDRQRAEEILKDYIPAPGQKATNLENLFKRIMEAFWNLAPGISPHITFALSVDTVLAYDLLNLVNGNQVNFIELVKILDYVALEDRRSKGHIIYNIFDKAKKADIAGILKKVLSTQSQGLQYVLLYMVISEEKYGKPGQYNHEMNWVHEFCCYTYSVGCIGGERERLGDAYRFEELVFRTSTLRDRMCSYMLSEVKRILQRVPRISNVAGAVTRDIKNLLEEVLGRHDGSVCVFEAGLNDLPIREYSKYWDKVYGIRNAGLLYSPAFTLHPLFTPRKTYPEVRIDLMLNAPYFCSIREGLEAPTKHDENSGNSRRVPLLPNDLYPKGELAKRFGVTLR